jgi:hypothetical protein
VFFLCFYLPKFHCNKILSLYSCTFFFYSAFIWILLLSS